MKPTILPRKFGHPLSPRVELISLVFPLLELIKILLNPFEPESRQQLENKVRLVDLLNGISNVAWRHQKGPSSIVIR